MAYGDLKVNNLIYDTGSGDATRSVVSIPLIASPTFTGTPAAPTASAGTSTTQIATTAFVATSFATKASPTFTGTPAAPTASANTNTTQIATTAFVMTELADYATLAAPAFTGTATGVNLTLSGNLTVNGTTTTIDTTNLDVEDKNITLGKVSSPSDTTADGGGITLKGSTDKTFNWVDANDAWTSSEHIHLGDNKKLYLGTDKDTSIFHSGANYFVENTTGNINLQSGGTIYLSNAAGSEVYAQFSENGACQLRYDNSAKLATTAAGVTVTGTVTDSKGDVRSIPQNTQGSAYELLAADAGKHILASGNITWVDSRHAAGDAITIVNNTSGNITITKGSNMYNAADGNNANRTLATRGMATILWVSGTVAYISGAGLS
jgi:hypothetical protein